MLKNADAAVGESYFLILIYKLWSKNISLSA